MQMTMSVYDFKKMCEKHSPKNIHYVTERQEWYECDMYREEEISFQKMIVDFNPNRICLRSGNNTMYFRKIKSVQIDTEATVLGTLLTLFCGDKHTDNNDVTYRLIVN